jgi:hypothetical protein
MHVTAGVAVDLHGAGEKCGRGSTFHRRCGEQISIISCSVRKRYSRVLGGEGGGCGGGGPIIEPKYRLSGS